MGPCPQWLLLAPMIAVSVPAGKTPETSFKIFLRVLPTTSPSTLPILDFVNSAVNVSVAEVAMSTLTLRFRTGISAGWTSEKERACWRLSEMCLHRRTSRFLSHFHLDPCLNDCLRSVGSDHTESPAPAVYKRGEGDNCSGSGRSL